MAHAIAGSATSCAVQTSQTLVRNAFAIASKSEKDQICWSTLLGLALFILYCASHTPVHSSRELIGFTSTIPVQNGIFHMLVQILSMA